MKKTILAVASVIILSVVGAAQTASTSNTASAANSTSVDKAGKVLNIESGTQITGQLQSSINADKAKVGDQVVLKTTKAVKQNGQVVIEKGSKLIGKVTEVRKKTSDTAGSSIGIVFDTLQQKDAVLPISATIVSVTKAAAGLSANEPLSTDVSGSGTGQATAQSSGGSGGLLSGVGDTVGGVANTATSAVGGIANTAGQTVRTTTRSLGSNIPGLQISQSADASTSGNSTLSMNTGNLKLDSGTTFTLAVSSSASGETNNR
jgi:hypothetical protein